jgi:ComB4 competence protein
MHKSNKNPKRSQKINEGVRYLYNEIPFLEIINDQTLSTSGMGLVQVIRFSGLDFASFSEGERQNLFLKRKNFFSSLSDRNVVVSFFFNRRKIRLDRKDFDKNFDTVREAITESWNLKFDHSYITEIYLVLRFQIPIENKLFDFLDDNERRDKKFDHYVNKLTQESESIVATMQDFNPTIISVDTGLLDFYHYLINNNCGTNSAINSRKRKIDDLLSLTDIEIDEDENIITLSCDGKKRYCRVVYPKVYPMDVSNELIFDSLLSSSCEFNLINHVIPESREDSKSFATKIIEKLNSVKESQWFGGRFEDITDVKEKLDSQEISLFEYLFVIQVFADSKEELNDSVKLVQDTLSRTGIPSVTFSIGLVLGYFTAFPDFEDMLRQRRVKYTDENLADLITIANDSQGFQKSDFGDEEIVKFKTASNSTYYFNLHASSARNAESHTLIIGSTNSGKSTLASFILANCLKFDKMKILCFDSLNGLYIPVTSFGGKYVDFDSDNLSLNPLLLQENFQNKEFLRDFIKILANGAKNKTEEDQISSFVRNNFKIDPDSRNLSSIVQISPKSEVDSLANRIEKFFPDHDLGKYFNGKKNLLSFENNFLGFNMTQLIQDSNKSEILTPLFYFITHSFAEYIRNNPSPHIVFIDEVGSYIKSDHFANFIEKACQEWRKKKGTIILAVQNPSQILDHPNGKKIITNISNYIIFPDPNASSEYYQRDLNLNDQEFAWVKNSNIYDRNILFKRKNGSSQILNIDLSYIGDYLNLFSGSSDLVREYKDMENSEKDTNKVIEKFVKIFSS